MRIVHMAPAYFPVRGGTEVLIQRVSEVLAQQGHHITVVTSNVTSVAGYYDVDATERLSPDTLKMNGVEIRRLPYGGIAYGMFRQSARISPVKYLSKRLESRALSAAFMEFKRRVHRQLATLRPDVVMAMPHLLPNVTAAVDICRKESLPLVIVPCLHEEDQHWPTIQVATALRTAEHVIAMTEHEAQRLVEAYGVEPERITIGWLGVDAPPEDFSSQPRAQTIIYLGRKAVNKGIPSLIAAMQQVWHTLPEARLVLAGARLPETAQIDALIAQLPPDKQRLIDSRDDISDQEKSDLLRTAMCLVLPSKVESFGGVILEAWAQGTPIIALDLSVFRSFVHDGVDGLLVRPDSVECLAQAILHLWRDRDYAVALGAAGYKKAAQGFTWEKVAGYYLAAYEKCLTHALHNIQVRTTR